MVRAAGGLVFRPTAEGSLQVLIAHRPTYGDWSLPKGKADEGETLEETAVREVLEETGYRCRIVAPIRTTRYPVDGDIKEVTWFAMRPLPNSPGFARSREIDAIKWVTRDEAREILDYDNDKNLVSGADLSEIARTGTIRLVRHAVAESRDRWQGDDRLRPLTKKGSRQAQAISEALAHGEIERIVTSPSLRCVQTVDPLAGAIDAEVETSEALAEGSDTDTAHALFASLTGYNAVLCSHGDVIPAVMHRLVWAGVSLQSDLLCAKGSIWEVDVERGQPATARYLPPPPV